MANKSTEPDSTPSKDASTSVVVTPSRLTSDFEGEIMRVNIRGRGEAATCQIHKHLLYQKSPYFAALNNFSESKQNEITLNDMSPDAFRNLAHWFYRDCLDPNAKDDPEILVETWIAADRLLMSKCKNVAMDELRKCCQYQYLESKILESTASIADSPQSTLIRYLTDQVAWDRIENNNIKDDEALPELDWQLIPEGIVFMLTTKMITFARKWRRHARNSNIHKCPDDPVYSEGCDYHDHLADETCYLESSI